MYDVKSCTIHSFYAAFDLCMMLGQLCDPGCRSGISWVLEVWFWCPKIFFYLGAPRNLILIIILTTFGPSRDHLGCLLVTFAVARVMLVPFWRLSGLVGSFLVPKVVPKVDLMCMLIFRSYFYLFCHHFVIKLSMLVPLGVHSIVAS